ncbi:MAG TPA: 5-(carboxyamino)imidazole ribonucleotide synthase [Xenococcaceae cyanobacterium]
MSSKRIGVIGGGQLAWMMGQAAKHLDIKLMIQTPHQNDPAVKIATAVILAPIDDSSATAKLATLCDVITFENEFINLKELQSLAAKGVCFRPSIDSVAPLLDKYDQRSYLKSIGLPVPQFTTLTSETDLANISQFPVVLKARRHGYDGQGTFIIYDQKELAATWDRLNCPPMVLEEFVPFIKELAVMVARNQSGEIVVYPVVETYQKNQVCHWVKVPAAVSVPIVEQIKAIARTLVAKLQVVGIFGIELFLTKDERVLVNEIAPRTHNSGHYTLDCCNISQFEMQLRTIADLPLISPSLKSAGAVMVNLLGFETTPPDYQAQLSQISLLPHTQVHWYGKTESRPGRKLGHVTRLLTETELSQGKAIAERIEAIWYGK